MTQYIEGTLFATPVMFKVEDNKINLFGNHEIDVPFNLDEIERISVNYGQVPEEKHYGIYVMFVTKDIANLDSIDLVVFDKQLDKEYIDLFWNRDK